LSTHPVGSLVSLGRHVRALGVPVTTSQIVNFVDALQETGIDCTADARLAAHATLASHPEHIPIIDLAFSRFWDGPVEPALTITPSEGSLDQLDEPAGPPGIEHTRDGAVPTRDQRSRVADAGLAGEANDGSISAAVFSSRERLRHKDFARYSPDEIQDAARFLRAIHWRPPGRVSRRRRALRHGREIDMRRLLRHSLKHGGEILELPRRETQSKPRHLVILCDVSGSMDAYTRMLLHLAHTISRSFDNVEIFLFGTRLTRITHLIHKHGSGHLGPDRAVDEICSEVHDWSGGTRIGEAIAAFHRIWARRVAAHGAVVLIVSDGWDRGDARQLRQEMARLQRLSHRLIWLNPLLGSRSYEPLTKGIRAALPYVDDFLPVHNLASLESLAVVLNSIGPNRPARRSR
jgi:uncharacterized protein